MTRRTFLDRLDTSVRWTGIPALAAGHPNRRPRRWPATIALAAALAGFGMIVADRTWYFAGFAVLMLGFTIAIFVQMLGPLKPLGTLERVDEWDRMARDRAAAFAYTLVRIVLPPALIVIGGVGVVLGGWDLARLQQVVVALGFLMMAVFAALPTAYASWTIRWQDEA